MAEGSYAAVSDRMKYGVKPTAVRSENYLHNIKASNGSTFPCTMGQDIIFEVPALGSGITATSQLPILVVLWM